MLNQAKRLLVMTSTIAPFPGVHALKRSDPLERLDDYRRALGFYLEGLSRGDIDEIVYVDNSGYDLSSLQALADHAVPGNRVEFISYRADVSPHNNRLYLEAHLIEHFLAHSALLWANPGADVWKVTGRYIIKNLRQIARGCVAETPHDICLNLRNYPYPVVDFYLIRFQVPAYRRLISAQLESFEGLEDGEKPCAKLSTRRRPMRWTSCDDFPSPRACSERAGGTGLPMAA
jgi:hypothetical protein